MCNGIPTDSKNRNNPLIIANIQIMYQNETLTHLIYVIIHQ